MLVSGTPSAQIQTAKLLQQWFVNRNTYQHHMPTDLIKNTKATTQTKAQPYSTHIAKLEMDEEDT